MPLSPKQLQILEKMRSAQKVIIQSKEEELPPDPETVPPVKSKKPSWSHQETAYRLAYHRNSFAFFMEMGTGKSKVAVDLIVNKGFKLSVIFTVKSAVDSVWPGEFEKYAAEPVQVLHLKFNKTAVEKVKIAKKFLEEAKSTGGAAVLVMNYELGIQPAMKSFLMGLPIDAVFCDESQKIQAPGGKASQFLYHLGKRVHYRYLLTGTPFPSSPLSIYGQYRFMEPNIFGTSFNAFKYQYADFDEFGVTEYKNFDDLNKKIYSRAYRVKSADVLDLPPLQTIERAFELSDKAQAAYMSMARTFLAKLDKGEIRTSNVLSRGLRFQQLTSGWLPVETEQGRELERVDFGKEEILTELLEGVEDEEPFVIFCRFTHDLDIVHKVSLKLGRKSLELSGRENQLDQWKAGAAPVLAVQIQAGGGGIDLTRAHYVCYYSIGYIQPATYEQSLFRAYRPGQRQSVTIYHIVAKNTIDRKIMYNLAHKLQINEEVLTYHLREVVTGK